MEFKSIDEKPNEDQLCLCECNEYCDEGVIVARFCFGIFSANNNNNVDQYITGWLPLNDDTGLPIE